MAETAGRGNRMAHRWGGSELVLMARETGVARDGDVMTGQMVDVGREDGGEGERPAQQHDEDGEDPEEAHRTAAHLATVAGAGGIEVEGRRPVGRGWWVLIGHARPGISKGFVRGGTNRTIREGVAFAFM